MEVTFALWAITIAGIIALILMDFLTVSRKPHEVKFKEALGWSLFYIGVAVAFGIAMWAWQGGDIGTQYFAAYLVEKSLSVDNLFVFIIILAQFAVPTDLHQRVLLVGVVLALILRAIFIAVGAAALAAFSFTFVLFGAILIWTGIQLARHRNEDPEPKDNAVVRMARKRFAFTDQYDGTRMFTRIEGKKVATPLLLVMIAIGSTDLLFALDSIPATFGVTQIPYLVFAANAFALLGLRALYFLLKGLLDKLVYLSTGLAVILVFIGIKLVLTYLHEVNPSIPHISTVQSLVFIVIVLVIVTVASWLKVRKDPDARAHAGRMTGGDRNDEGPGTAG
ncbi:MAG: TerC/Alx family metal homeostasis membrane protein [Actinomycetota bacterium]|nr:TerC/Alx family metal homeostasis membrane protein [Actinomycetota bacterium]